MVKIENECVGCPSEMGCMHKCKNEKVSRLYCDECGEEVDELYIYDDDSELCKDCLLNKFKMVEV